VPERIQQEVESLKNQGSSDGNVLNLRFSLVPLSVAKLAVFVFLELSGLDSSTLMEQIQYKGSAQFSTIVEIVDEFRAKETESEEIANWREKWDQATWSRDELARDLVDRLVRMKLK
jgi:hypothetical protein